MPVDYKKDPPPAWPLTVIAKLETFDYQASNYEIHDSGALVVLEKDGRTVVFAPGEWYRVIWARTW